MARDLMWAGLAVMVVMFFGWFGTVVMESEGGMYRAWEDKSFRLGMAWFIFSEVMFFAAFFGALFYARALSVPWLLGEGSGAQTHQFLWGGYTEIWPTNGPRQPRRKRFSHALVAIAVHQHRHLVDFGLDRHLGRTTASK